MRKIKSERSEIYISEKSEWDDSLLNGYFVYPEDALEAIRIAEQDAEERAIEAFKEWCVETNPHFEKTLAGQREQDRFAELLKGGQEDE